MSAYSTMDADTMAALTGQEWTDEALEQLAECSADPEHRLSHPFQVYRMEAQSLAQALMDWAPRRTKARGIFTLRHQHGGIVWFTYTRGKDRRTFSRFGRIVRGC